MSRRIGILASQACLVLVEASFRSGAFAQGLPTPGPGPVPLAPADGANIMVPMIVLGAALLGGLIFAVALMDLRRKRQAEMVAIEGQISDALMREPRLITATLTPVAHVPLSARSAPTVEIRGAVEYPELREIAVRIVRQELLRHHPDGRVEDRIFVAPPVLTAPR
jgi:hypothetical protein